MPSPLRLTLTDYLDATRWRWVLSDSRGDFLADHVVQLDPTTREYRGFLDLSTYLDYHKPIYPPEQQLADLGTWIGEKVFGGLREALWKRRALPAVAVQVVVPEAAQDLLFRPFELARFADGRSFGKAGVRFVYGLEGTAAGAVAKEPVEKALRILAAFSLPVRANPLNLRRERYGLQRLVRDLNQTQNLAVELRVLQYGATRDTLQEALEEAEGWDIIHLSGHGQQGELLLEDDRGGSDTINAEELGRAAGPGAGAAEAAHSGRLLQRRGQPGRGPRAGGAGAGGRPPGGGRGSGAGRRPPGRRCRAWPRRCRNGSTAPRWPCATRWATPSPPS